jgi:hypothetical protein
MRSFIAAALLVPSLLVLPPACGGTSGQYGDKCEVACKPPAGPCGSEDPGNCQQACVVATEGLNVECAQCIAENSGWHGQTCTCSGNNCSIDSFGSSSNGDTTSGGGPAQTCDPVADTKCSGFDIESITASACQSVCLVK